MLFVLFQIQDDLSLCLDPGILFVCLCFHLTWLQLLFAIIIILDLHFVSDRTCCMLWTGNIQNRYIRLHQVCMCNFNSKPEFVWVYNHFIYSSYLPQFQWQNHSHATRPLVVLEPVWMRLVTLFQQVTAVMIWELVHTCRTTAPVYYVRKVSFNLLVNFPIPKSTIIVHHVNSIK